MLKQPPDYLKELRKFYQEAVQLYVGKPKGCGSNEIEELEREVEYALPEAYKQYLAWMGNDYEGIFKGTNPTSAGFSDSKHFLTIFH